MALKAGIIGAGYMSTQHLDGIKGHETLIEAFAICDNDLETLNTRAEEHHIPNAYTEFSELVKSGIDVAIVCTPTGIRRQVVLPLIEAGIPVLCEKPFADTLVEAKEIALFAQEKNVPLAINQNFRYSYPFDAVKKVISEERLGKIISVSLQNMTFRQDEGWRLNCERHALSVMGVHWLDGFRWILGSEAKMINCFTGSSAAIECAGETDANVQILFQSGAMVSYLQSFSSLKSKTDLLVIGEAGTLTVGDDGATVYKTVAGEVTQEKIENPWQYPATLFVNLKNLLDWMESGKEAPNSARDNLKTIALLEGAYISAAEQKTVCFGKDGELI